MGTKINQITAEETGPTLQLKRSLLPIDEYATREGLSKDLVEEWGKLGIVQIRKYKGKMFVVDVPLSQYPYTPETRETTHRSAQLTSENNQSEDTPELREIIDELTAAADEITKTKSLSQSTQIPDLQTFQITDEQPKLVDETVQVKEKPKSTQVIQDNGIQLGLLTAQAKSKRTWQIATVLSIAFLFATLFAYLWTYIEHKNQLEKLHQANASIQIAYNNSRQAIQQVETLQNELSNSKTQIGRLQNELDSYEAQVKTLQNELTQTRQNLRDIQERNAEAVERLNRQIQKLSALPHNNYNNQ